MLNPIISIETQRDAVFPPTLNTLQPNPVTLASAANVLSLDSNIRNWVSNTFGWVSIKLSTSTASKGVNTPNSNADSARVTDDALPDLLLKDLSISGKKTLSSRERHEYSQWLALEPWTLSDTPYAKMNNIMIQRCKKHYLFDCEKNREILADNRWLQEVWLWIEGPLTLLVS